jgi:hypothetical protein
VFNFEYCFINLVTIADDPENESEEDNDKLENDVYCMEDNNEVFFESDDEEEIERLKVLISPHIKSVLLFLLMWQVMINSPDASLSMLIAFMCAFLKLFQTVTNNDVISEWITNFPSSLQSVRLQLTGDNIKFYEYIVCRKCHSLYDYDACVIRSGRIQMSKKCQYIQFPNHPNVSFRSPCNSDFLCSVMQHSNSKCLKPHKSFSYQSLKDGVSRLLKNATFLEKCEEWRNRKTLTGYLGNVYDGQVWSDFHCFHSQRHSWCVALNVDWFQSFTHISDSVGALCLIVLNLPREERLKKENMTLVGIIPGPHEPSLNINSYLTSLVIELKDFYTGVSLPCVSPDGKRTTSRIIRLALVGVFSDLPASRKVCGFPSFNALHGCNRCLKQFVTSSFGEKPDYSGYDRNSWPVRDLSIHRQKCYEYIRCNTKAAQKHIERQYGLRYSALIELPYFNPIRYTAVDPMHNLFLGTAKHCMEVWINTGVLCKRDIQLIEEKVSQLKAPHSLGRLPLKIASGFAGFTADQWKNWTLSFSAIALRGILPQEHLQYWLLFVKACSLICVRRLSKQNIDLADNYFKLFCSKFSVVNGATYCTPNMHLHMHLKECLFDYGPPYSFWCFGFESFNGILGSFPTNRKNVEPQLMKKCLLQELHTHTFPSEGETFHSILTTHLPFYIW